MNHQSDPQPSVTCLALVVEGGLALLALALGWLINCWPLESLELTRDALPGHLVAILWGVAAVVPMMLSLWWVETTSLRPLRELRQVVEQKIVPLFVRESVGQLALISAMAGLGEELLFRGLVQAGMASRIGGNHGAWIAIVTASVAFGLAHSISWTYMILATLIGAYLGWLFWFSGHLLVPVVAHGLYDFFALVYFVKWKRACA